jgi:hypothetical protein
MTRSPDFNGSGASPIDYPKDWNNLDRCSGRSILSFAAKTKQFVGKRH